MNSIQQTQKGDAAYVPLKSGVFVYLATLLDLYSGRIVGWHLAETMDNSLVLKALSVAVFCPARGWVCWFWSSHNANLPQV